MEAVKPAVKADPKLANAWKTVKAGRDLTEAELQAMPESEYMNDKQLDFFRSQLATAEGRPAQQRRRDHRAPARGHHHRADPADRATIEEEHALELRTRPRAQAAEEDLAVPGAAGSSGDYGYCDETGEPIGLAPAAGSPDGHAVA